jgi:Fe-S oxidoreductase
MLTLPERILFILVLIGSLYLAYRAGMRIARSIGRGQGKVDWSVVPGRLVSALAKAGTLAPTFRLRLGASIFHAMVAWGFIYYLLVNIGDVLKGFISDFEFMGTGAIGDVYRFGADILSVGILVGMAVLLVRRFVIGTPELAAREDILLPEKVRFGIRRDSLIVGSFILVHVGSRFLGDAFESVLHPDIGGRPFASAVGSLFANLDPAALRIGQHAFWWLALGTILLFVPYFLYSKHLHLIMTPVNFLLTPHRRSIGQLERLNFDDESIEQFGASRLEDLSWELIMDAYACIMCYRCQQVCPAYNTGKVLSPAAMEINKRYMLNVEGDRLAKGEASSQTLLEFAISPEAVWACTACGACIDICPVGNEPMRDIMQIRRAMVLMDNEFPDELQTAFRGMERSVNPWNISPAERMKWAEGLKVPTIEENPEPDLLWWVGCAPSTDARAQKTARAFAQILNQAGVSYAVLGEQEQCNGDSARRAGNEFLFNELALANVEILNEVAPKRIVTTCPHCLHVLGTEYPDFGGNYSVIHHSQLINELVGAGKIRLNGSSPQKLTFHDPCYLGRHNDIVDAPREVLKGIQGEYIEMPRSGKKSFCCGAGGAQMWKEEEEGFKRVSAERMDEASATGAQTLAVGCPFCMVMLTDAQKAGSNQIEIQDIAEIVLASMEK